MKYKSYAMIFHVIHVSVKFVLRTKSKINVTMFEDFPSTENSKLDKDDVIVFRCVKIYMQC